MVALEGLRETPEVQEPWSVTEGVCMCVYTQEGEAILCASEVLREQGEQESSAVTGTWSHVVVPGFPCSDPCPAGNRRP